MGIGGLLCLGIGDTIRVSLTADPVREVVAAKAILKAAGLRKQGVNLISCPTCGRTKIDLIGLANRVQEALQELIKGADASLCHGQYCERAGRGARGEHWSQAATAAACCSCTVS